MGLAAARFVHVEEQLRNRDTQCFRERQQRLDMWRALGIFNHRKIRNTDTGFLGELLLGEEEVLV